MLKVSKKIIVFLLLTLGLGACSVQKVAIRSASGIFDAGSKSIFSETDYEFAKLSIPANLKLLESLYNVDPNNYNLVVLLVQGYTGYAMGFVEDEDPQRAKMLYKRAFNYGIDFLRKKNKKFVESLDGEFERFEKVLWSSFSKKDVPILFWTAMAWGSYVNLSRDEPDAIAQVPKIESIVKRSISLDENYFYGSGNMFLGVLLSAKPRIFGGDPERGREYFEKCIKITDGKYLLPHVFYARYYAVQVQDKELFENLLNYVLESPTDLLKGAELLNVIAKRKAQKYMELANELF